jgi:hypothetical protein
MKRKLLTETPVCPQERLVIISYTTGLSFALERIGPLAAIIITVFYLLVLYLLALPNTPENLFASIYSESLIKTTHQHLLLLVGFDTLIYRKYYVTPPILVGHHCLGEVLIVHVKDNNLVSKNERQQLHFSDNFSLFNRAFFSVRWSMPNKSQNPQVHTPYFILGFYLGKHRYRMLDFLFYIEIVLGQTQVRFATSSAMSSLLKLFFDEISEPCKFDV